MRPGRSPDDIEMRFGIGDPVPQRLIHGILERAGSGGHRMHHSPEQTHAVNSGFLPFDILGPHENLTFHAEQRTGGCGGNTVLAGAGFSDDTGLAHAPCQQGLADHVVDFMGAGVVQLIAFHVELGTTKMLGQAISVIERRGAANVMLVIPGEIILKFRVGFGFFPGGFDLQNQGHQGFGHKAAAMDTETAILIRHAAV